MISNFGTVLKNLGHYAQNLSNTEPVDILDIFPCGESPGLLSAAVPRVDAKENASRAFVHA
jgi:hypothetical protein